MSEQIIVGPNISSGLVNNRLPFAIDNDSFPVLQNAYQWRGRVKRKRGTSSLTRMNRFFNSLNTSYTSTSTLTIGSDDSVNLITGFGLEKNSNLFAGSVVINDESSSMTYLDNGTGSLLLGMTISGTVNYSNGVITIPGISGDTIDANFRYYPNLPSMGQEELNLNASEFPGTITFDTKYAYNILPTLSGSGTNAYPSYDVSFYKNPVSGTYNNYIAKSIPTPTSWNGFDYQQFWTINYENAFWVTNGINVPFNPSTVGMQFSPSSNITYVSNTTSTITLTITSCPLIVGDFVYFNEWAGGNGDNLNYQTGYITSVSGTTFIVTFPQDVLTNSTSTSGGIIQYLTNRSDVTIDCLRWYDGDPTNGNNINPTLNGHNGWVNFAPPLTNGTFSIDDTPEGKYYLVGARIIYPFKDRILFFGPVIQNSSGSKFYLQDTVIYSQNGTPFYTTSFTGAVPTVPEDLISVLVPQPQDAFPPAFFEDVTGFGGNLPAGLPLPIISVSPNEDVLIVGFTGLQSRLVYSGNDLVPFNFYVINSEFGTNSTFSVITMDKAVLSKGSRGYIITGQTDCSRIDINIPDEVFEVDLSVNGNERFTAQRDFINEWVYFTYPVNSSPYSYPSKTLLFNYRDNTWATFIENYTSYGSFRASSGYTWGTIGTLYPTWGSWNVPWGAGSSTPLQPEVICGNQQGFIVQRATGSTNEAPSLCINAITFVSNITNITQASQAVVTVTGNFGLGQTVTFTGVEGMIEINNLSGIIINITQTTITVSINSNTFSAYTSGGTLTPLNMIYSPNHCLNNGDFILISGALGTISETVDGFIFQVSNATITGFDLNPTPESGTYLGGGLITRYYIPMIITKQFPAYWNMSRKTRIGPHKYLFTKTPSAQITLLIFLSQDSSNAYNTGEIVPQPFPINNSLIYSTILHTCPESSNLGLTAFTSNLQTPTASSQSQIWHRKNTSLIGDTIQIGFTLSDAQMSTQLQAQGQQNVITGATNANPCVLMSSSQYATGTLILITNIIGMNELNNNIYYVISSTSTTVTINVDSTNFGTYISGGFSDSVSPNYQIAEIELHGFILDINPSQLLV